MVETAHSASESQIILPSGVERPTENGQDSSPVGTLRALSDLVERIKLATQAGMTFEGERDLFKALGYKKRLKAEDYRARYCRNAIAARIVEALPKATWRGTAQLTETEDPKDDTPFEVAAQEFARKHQLWSTFLRADILAGLGRYAVILIGAPGDLERPLGRLSEKSVFFLSVFGEEDVDIQSLIEDPSNPRFGFPEKYRFKRLTKRSAKSVHWSRVIHIADGVIDDPIHGVPRLERSWNLLDDLEKVTGAGAEAFWLRAHQGLVASIDKDLKMEQSDITDLKNQMEEFAHQIRRTIGQRGINVQALGSDVARFGDQVDAILTQIAGGAGIPKRVLTGSEMGELASSQDRRTWEERVIDRREQFAAPHIVRQLIDRLIEHRALPQPEQYEVSWPSIGELNDKERAEVASAWTLLNLRQFQAGQPAAVSVGEIRDRVLQLPPRDDDDDDDIDLQVPPVPEAQPPDDDGEGDEGGDDDDDGDEGDEGEE